MKKHLLLTLALGVLFTSCSDQNLHKGYLKTENGLFYRFHEQNQGETPQIMDLLDVQIACFVNDTAVIIPNNPMTMQLSEPLFAGDLFEGLKMMHLGDSASFIVRVDSTFYTLFQAPTLPSDFNNDDVMRFDVKLKDFYPESEFMARRIANIKNTYPVETENAAQELQKYFEDNNITATPTATGLYYVKTQDGNGEKPADGTMVSVHYTGTLLDGTKFDSSLDRGEPIQFVLGVGQVIPGWDEGIKMMSKGEKGVLYIPYYLAYGDRDSGPIPAFSTLIFEVELVDF